MSPGFYLAQAVALAARERAERRLKQLKDPIFLHIAFTTAQAADWKNVRPDVLLALAEWLKLRKAQRARWRRAAEASAQGGNVVKFLQGYRRER